MAAPGPARIQRIHTNTHTHINTHSQTQRPIQSPPQIHTNTLRRSIHLDLEFIPKHERENSMRTKTKVMRSNSFKESKHSFTFENLDENIAEMVVDEPSTVCVDTLVVHARSDDIKRSHGDRNKHRGTHGGSYGNHEGARGKPLFLDDYLKYSRQVLEDII